MCVEACSLDLITVEKLCLFISGNFVHIVIFAVNIVVIWTKKISVLLAPNAQCNYVKIIWKKCLFCLKVEILCVLLYWILQNYTRIDLKSTLSFWDLNQFDDPRFRHCGMWYTHVDTCVCGQPWHVRDDTWPAVRDTWCEHDPRCAECACMKYLS